MTDKKPNLIFKIVDPIFLKLGKPIARHIAKKDQTEDILFKRENQANLIVTTVITIMSYSHRVLEKPSKLISCRIFNIFGVLAGLASSLATHSQYNYLVWRTVLIVALTTLIWDVIGTIAINQELIKMATVFFYKNNAVPVLKEESFRIDSFYTINKPTKLSLVFNVLAVIFCSIMVSIQSLIPFVIFLISLYAISVFLVVVSWIVNYLLMAAIYHCDDFGEKEKETSKEKNSHMVADSV